MAENQPAANHLEANQPVTSSAQLEQLLNTDHEVTPGQCQQLSPLVRRITADNPGKFTFKGTGTYLVGRERVAVIDPGPAEAAHVQAILDAVAGADVSHIVITHTHRDHSPAAKELVAATGAVTYGFGPHPADPQDYPYSFNTGKIASDPETGNSETGDPNTSDTEKSGDLEFTPQETLQHGDIIEGHDWQLECQHTPGHISNHLCFALTQESTLFTGDHIMGWSSTIIPPPHGSLADYLASLRLLLNREDACYLPTHGPAIDTSGGRSPQGFVQAILSHREQRSAQILHQLSAGNQTIAELVAAMYHDKPLALHLPAAQSVIAHLIFLLEASQIKMLEGSDETPHRFALA